MNMRIVAALSAIALWSASRSFDGQAAPPVQVAALGSCPLLDGGELPDCRLSYRVFGTMNAERSNVVLLPTWFNGSSQNWAALMGSAGYVDTAIYAAIAVDAFGAGRSSSPSDSVWRGRAFPRVTIHDMVAAQRVLLERLGVQELQAVVGISMGGMQAFEWAVAYPSVVRRIVSIEGSPRLTTYDRVLWDAMLHAVGVEPQMGVPRDSSLRELARLFILAASTPAAVNLRPPDSTAAIIDNQARGLSARPFENLALQLGAMLTHDVSHHTAGDVVAAGQAITARVLVVASPDDHAVTPQSALMLARQIGADTLLVPSMCGHQVYNCERARIGLAVRAFLAAR